MSTTPFEGLLFLGGCPSAFLVIPAKAGISTPFPLTNLSLDVCIPRSQNSFHSTVLSGSTHLGQKTSGGSGLRIYAGAKIYYRSDPLLPAETLVTVSPCEFPRDVFPAPPSSSSSRRRGSTIILSGISLPFPLSPRSLLLVIPDLVGDLPSFPAFHSPFIWHFRKFYIDCIQTTFSRGTGYEKSFFGVFPCRNGTTCCLR